MAVILMFGAVSGAHLNPVVSIADAALGRISWREVSAYAPAQVLGCIGGAILANVMFSEAAISISTKHRASGAHFLSEIVATAGLLVLIFALVRSDRRSAIPVAVGGYIAGAYFFTSSTSFANPAITVGRMFSSFAGIAPSSVPIFIGAELRRSRACPDRGPRTGDHAEGQRRGARSAPRATSLEAIEPEPVP